MELQVELERLKLAGAKEKLAADAEQRRADAEARRDAAAALRETRMLDLMEFLTKKFPVGR